MYSFIYFLKNIKGSQKQISPVVIVCCVVLFFGGIILFSTRGNTSSDDNIVEERCTDSDGSSIYTKGAITYTDSKGRHVDEDYCFPTEKQVYEMSCQKKSWWSSFSFPERKTYDCSKECINGACMR